MSLQHTPVLLKEVLDFLNIRPELIWVDATAGGGGHLSGIIERAGPNATVVGIDRDQISLDALSKRLPGKFISIHSNFSELETALQEAGINTVTGGIVADLGLSSLQLDDAGRGFSFDVDGPLDMRMDVSLEVTAADLVNSLSEDNLSDIIATYGEERFHRAMARAIVHARPIESTSQLAQIAAAVIGKSSGQKHRPYRIHPATRTFQALRIAVNDELASLKEFLVSAIKVLSPGARLAVISFHSLEDRIVKQIFREAAATCVCPPRQPICTCNKQPQLLIITRKPVVPNEAERLANPRSRSAKLRVVEKI